MIGLLRRAARLTPRPDPPILIRMSDIHIQQDAQDNIGPVYQIGYVAGDLIIRQPDAPPPLLPARAPDILFGRDELCKDVQGDLMMDGPVLLHGVGGIGKTALAATIAQQWLADERSPGVLWLTVGTADLTGILTGIGSAFGAEGGRAIAAAPDDAAKLGVARALIGRVQPLVVLDDCWHAPPLAAVLQQAIPSGVPTLVTSRTRFDAIQARHDVTRLPRPDSLGLLIHHAGRSLPPRDAETLCETLGDHPYAVEIAGAWLGDESLEPGDLLRRLGDAPQDLTMPEGFAMPGRENVAALIQTSVEALGEDAKRAFYTLGTLFAPRATPELLAMVQAGTHVVFNEQFKPTNIENMPTEADIQRAADALRALARRSLARYVGPEQYSAAYYAVHDLSQAFARAPLTGESRGEAVAACVAYARHHAHKPDTPAGVAHHNALEADLPNLLGAAQYAAQVVARNTADDDMRAAVNRLGWDLYGSSHFLNVRGRAAESMTLLRSAAEAARALGLPRDEGSHLNHLGLAHAALGRYREAIPLYERALEIDREIGDRRGEGSDLGNLGLAYADLGEYTRAIAYYEQRLVIAREIGDRRGEGNALGNLGNAYADLGEYTRAIEYHEQALVISREIGDRRGEGSDLGNLGLAYADLGEYTRAIEYHEQALEVLRDIGDRRGEGSVLGNLGEAYRNLGEYTRAIAYYEQALEVLRDIGDRRGEGSVLGNLGIAYYSLGEYTRAIDYYEQRIEIAREIGDRRGEASTLFNTAILHHEQGDHAAALAGFQAAWALYDAMGVVHLVAECDRAIAVVQAALGGDS
jgi:tetratricopeptide (TPR) repeat protein